MKVMEVKDAGSEFPNLSLIIRNQYLPNCASFAICVSWMIFLKICSS